jgi:hypothetical protein
MNKIYKPQLDNKGQANADSTNDGGDWLFHGYGENIVI